jgi:hypothetical protein
MSYYVRRTGTREDLLTGAQVDRSGWTGPIDDAQAEREAEAWRSAGWTATVEPDSPAIRAEVRAWEQAQAASWKDSTDPSQRRRYWESVHGGEKCECCGAVVDEPHFDPDSGLCDDCSDYNASRVVL